MTEKSFIRADAVAEELDVSKSYAYKVIKQLNDELSAKGYITVAGRISRQYFILMKEFTEQKGERYNAGL